MGKRYGKETILPGKSKKTCNRKSNHTNTKEELIVPQESKIGLDIINRSKKAVLYNTQDINKQIKQGN